MARTQQQIKDSMTAGYITNPIVQQLYGLTPSKTFAQEFSLVSLENILFDVIAFALWTFETILDIFRAEIGVLIAQTKPFTRQWYEKTALDYQHGFGLDASGNFVNGLATSEEIAASKIVAKTAFEKTVIQGHGVLRCKVAKNQGADLVPLTSEELSGFDAYINKKTAFGLRVISISRPHDNLVLSMKIWYDPLVLNSAGARRDGTDDKPVINAINAYLQSLEFNGELVLTQLTDALQKIEGVKIPKITAASSNWSSYMIARADGVGGNSYSGNIEETRVAFSGYMRLDEDLSSFEYVSKN